jgi:hypothetical protein
MAKKFLRSRQLCSTEELPKMLWNTKVHYNAHKSPLLVPILSQNNPVHTIPSYLSLRSILTLSTHLHLGLHSCVFPSDTSHQYPICILLLPIRATCLTYLVVLDLVILIILGERYKLWSSSLCSFLKPAVTSSLFGPNIPPLISQTKFYIHTEPQAKL